MPRARSLLVIVNLLVTAACGGSGGGGSGSGDALGPPTGVTADALSATSVQLNWQDKSWAEDGFRIDRALGTGNWVVAAYAPANEVSYVDTFNLSGGKQYLYRVVAYTTGRESRSGEVLVTTLPPGTGAGTGTGTGTIPKIRKPIGADPTDAANNYYNASGFLNLVNGKHHLGDDWNGKSGGDTDLGKPVYAVANGTVKAAKDFGTGWGNCVAIEHDFSGVKYVSWYAHLNAIDAGVKVGQLISEGTKVGGIGKGDNNRYAAHLHFEWRKGSWSTPRDIAGPGYVASKTTPPPQGQVDPLPYY